RGMYRDPDLQAQRSPAQIGDDFVRQAETMLARIRWSRREIEDFLGHYLSEPKAHVQFERPRRVMPLDAFARTLARRGVRLALTSAMLYRGSRWYLNGEAIIAAPEWRATLRGLADRRALPPGTTVDDALLNLLHEWYAAGYLLAGAAGGPGGIQSAPLFLGGLASKTY